MIDRYRVKLLGLLLQEEKEENRIGTGLEAKGKREGRETQKRKTGGAETGK